VSILPAHDAAQSNWEWTAQCPFNAAAGATCASKTANLGYAQLSGDEWNLGAGGSGQGFVGMSLRPTGELDIAGALKSSPPCTASSCGAPAANTWVRGYPSVLYGINPCYVSSSPPRSPKLALPMNLTALDSLTGTTSYTTQLAKVTSNVAYDLWLNSSKAETCRTNGTIEVMIWTDYDARALLPKSLRLGTGSIPYTAHGVVNPGTNAWSIYAANVDKDGKTASSGGTIWLVLRQSDTVAAGTVSIDLHDALATVGSQLQHSYGWSNFDTQYWLDTISFGTQYGPMSGVSSASGPSVFSLHLSQYCLNLGRSLATVDC
jgi:hypothetical protein